MDAIGNPMEPLYGLPAGCPFATFFLAILTQPWRKRLRAMPSAPSVRTWVDDCSTFVQGRVAAVAMAGQAGRTAEDMQLMGLQPNTTKSGVVGSSPTHTEEMREAAGPLFACREPLKDLGNPRRRRKRRRGGDEPMAHGL